MSSQDSSVAPTTEEKFLAHLGRAGELITARRLEEAEVEVLRALSVLPGERRALNLVALVRFKLGRIEEAHEAYREIAQLAPDDPGVRLNMGLLALKLERFGEAVESLELAGQLQPGDLRVWSYLGFAYSRQGQTALAAAAFRRAGQEDLAAELERAESRADVAADGGDEVAVGGDAAAEAAHQATADDRRPSVNDASTVEVAPVHIESVDEPEPVAFESAERSKVAHDEFAASPATVAGLARAADHGADATVVAAPETGSVESVAAFAVAHLMTATSGGPSLSSAPSGVVRVQVRGEAYVRADAAVAHGGQIEWEPGRRRVRGRLQTEALGAAERPLYRLRGSGDVWVSLPSARVVALALDDDMLYVREDRVVAFDGDVAWEAGRLPRDGLRLVQFRGRGRIAIEVAGAPLTLKLEPDRPTTVARDRMLGWIGRVQPRGGGDARPGTSGQVTCEGEGVLLLEVGPSRILGSEVAVHEPRGVAASGS